MISVCSAALSPTAEMIAPDTGESIRTTIEVRIDPLTGHSSRILPERGLMPASDFDLERFARENRARCPFCPERIESLTPRLPAAIDATFSIAWASRYVNNFLDTDDRIKRVYVQADAPYRMNPEDINLYYVRNVSVAFDLFVLLLTARTILLARGAR